MNGFRIFVDFILPPDALDLLRVGCRGHELVFSERPAASVLATAAHDPQVATADIVFGQPDPAMLRDAPRLKWLQVSTSSITRYDHPAFRALVAQRGIRVSNSASVYSEACAEHALSFMLAQSRRLAVSLQTRTPGGSDTWHALRQSCVPLRGQTLLLLGYGAIGRRLVELLRPFGMNILAYRRRARGDEGVPVISEAELEATLKSGVDHLMNILPDSAQTRGFFNADRFASMRPGAVFYNIGRGATVDQDALLNALRAGQLKAAWLDVTDPEPLPDDHPLRMLPNCHITPHVAGGHADEAQTLVRHFLENLGHFVRQEPLRDRVM